jgi:hypothetical protein
MERIVEYPDAGEIRVHSDTIGGRVKLYTTSLGRNGTINTRGLVIHSRPSVITLTPITSRGLMGRCYIEVHQDSLRDLISQLNAIRLELPGCSDL